MKIRWKSFVIALLIIIAGGVVRLPLEQAYTKEMRKQQLLETPLNLSMRDELGQTFFIAVLGGFRSAVASIMELKSITAWQNSNWGVVDQYYSICTRLQPREEHYWESRAWHLAANARDTYLWDSMLSETGRHAQGQQYVEKGMDVIREGLRYLPESWKLWDRLGWYASMPYNEKPDHAAAAEAYAKAAALPGGRRFLWRMHVYEVAKIPGREREAWDKLLALYNSGDDLDHTISVDAELLLLHPKLPREPGTALPERLERIAADRNLSEGEKKQSWALVQRCGDRLVENADFAAAADYFANAAAARGGRGFYRRLHAYAVARIPGREREAWSKLTELYYSPNILDRTLTVEMELARLYLRVFYGQPGFLLPPDLARLINPDRELTEAGKNHSAELLRRYRLRTGESSPVPRPPIVESPNLQKLRPR
ncbi:MAG TPA: hypothetical protein VG796_02520 [Verrucomicrobiales bacterium]|jgi:hypothetical protein|nr:hypothetical protein [Verrucomicrobiales bacterium]